jgi:hypothetical protein
MSIPFNRSRGVATRDERPRLILGAIWLMAR